MFPQSSLREVDVETTNEPLRSCGPDPDIGQANAVEKIGVYRSDQTEVC